MPDIEHVIGSASIIIDGADKINGFASNVFA